VVQAVYYAFFIPVVAMGKCKVNNSNLPYMSDIILFMREITWFCWFRTSYLKSSYVSNLDPSCSVPNASYRASTHHDDFNDPVLVEEVEGAIQVKSIYSLGW